MAKKPDSGKHFDDQFDDENVLFVFRKHPIVMRKGLLLWAVGVLVGPIYTLILTVIYRNNPERYPSPGFFFISLALSIVLSLLLILPWWIAWYYSLFIVTDQRLIQITRKGLFHQTVVDLTLGQIQMVNYQIAGLQESMLGYGTIMMQTYVGDLVIHDVHHPAKIQKEILSVLRKQGIVSKNLPINKEDEYEEEAEEAD
ncbi:MAG TPA: PH domain-containing protein [Candidatus Saccharimonadales bacterium]|nr:PH domain-containing protein [Candidatus Saccharimonadales bacterium]